MASVLTDQVRFGSVAAPLAPVPNASASFVQFKTGYSETGNFVVKLPAPDGAADAYNSATVVNNYKRYNVDCLFNVKTTTTVNVTVNLVLTDSAGTVTIIATSGAKAVNSTTSTGRLTAEFAIDPTAAVIAGVIDGYTGANVVAKAALTNAVAVVQNNATAVTLGVSVQLSGADASSVFTIQELALEVL